MSKTLLEFLFAVLLGIFDVFSKFAIIFLAVYLAIKAAAK